MSHYKDIKNAVAKGDIDLVYAIFQREAGSLDDNIILIQAIEEGNMDVVVVLLKLGMDSQVNNSAREGKTPLDIANALGNKAIIHKIFEKIYLDEIGHYMDPNVLAMDPLANTPFLNKDAVNTELTVNVSSYSQFLTTHHVAPSDERFLDYLSELTNALQKQTSFDPRTPLITKSEADIVQARKLWSDVVSTMDRVNGEEEKLVDVDQAIMRRFRELGYTDDVPKILNDSLNFLHNNTSIVLTFNAKFLEKKGFMTDQILNQFENATRDSRYQAQRSITERTMLKKVGPQLTNALMAKNHAKPRYASLQLLDNTHSVHATRQYGQSYIVLQDVVKLNSLFNPLDSMEAILDQRKAVTPCTVHHMKWLLYQADDWLLQALAEASQTGQLPENYTQQYKSGCQLIKANTDPKDSFETFGKLLQGKDGVISYQDDLFYADFWGKKITPIDQTQCDPNQWLALNDLFTQFTGSVSHVAKKDLKLVTAVTGRSQEGGYVEVLLPPISLLDPVYVKHIHISGREYQLSAEDKTRIESLGITISNENAPQMAATHSTLRGNSSTFFQGLRPASGATGKKDLEKSAMKNLSSRL